MGTKYTQIRYAMAPFEGGRFARANQSGDWLDIQISFEGDLPVKVPNFVGTPRVIITPVRNTNFDPTSTTERFNVMTPVCVARDVTPTGFRLAARNADPDFGGFQLDRDRRDTRDREHRASFGVGTVSPTTLWSCVRQFPR